MKVVCSKYNNQSQSKIKLILSEIAWLLNNIRKTKPYTKFSHFFRENNFSKNHKDWVTPGIPISFIVLPHFSDFFGHSTNICSIVKKFHKQLTDAKKDILE